MIMRKNKSGGALAAGALAMLLVAAGCGGNGANGGTPNTPGASPGSARAETGTSAIPADKAFVIKLMDWQGQNPPYQAAYDNAFDEYMKLHPNVKIDHIYQPNVNNGYEQLLDTQFVSHNAPDAMQLVTAMINKYTDQQYIMSLDGYLNEPTPYSDGKRWIETFTGGDDAFLQGKLNNKFGVVSFFPIEGGMGINQNRPFYYNKDLLQKAGITEIPRTWAEFMEACRKLKEAGITPVAADNNRWVTWINTWTGDQLGENSLSQYFDDKYKDTLELYGNKRNVAVVTGKLGVDDPIVNAQVDLLKAFSQYWQDGWAGATEQAAQQLFLYQKAAFLLDGNWNYGFYQDNIKDFQWDLMPFPLITKETTPYAEEAFPKGAGTLSVNGWSLNSDLEKDPDKLKVVLDIFQYVTSKDAQDRFVDIATANSPIAGVHVPEAMKAFMETDKNKLMTPAGNSLFLEAEPSVNLAASQQFYSGKITKEQYLSVLEESAKKNATKKARDLLDGQTGLPNTIALVEKQIGELESSGAPELLVDAKKKSLETLKLQLAFYKQYAEPVLASAK